MPERGESDPQHDDTQQEDQNVLSSLPLVERSGVRQYAINSDRVGDVLDLAISERFVAANQFVLDLLVDAAGDKHLTRLRDTFKSRRDVDSIAIDVVFFNEEGTIVKVFPV